MKVIIIHGAYGSPEENWIPWLKEELESRGHQTYVPRFPTPEGQNLENWLRIFSEYSSKIDADTVLVGHSIGAAFILNVIERLNKPIRAAFLVAGFIELLNNKEVDPINKTIVERRFDPTKIRQNCKRFFIYASDNDPYVPLEKAQKVCDLAGTKMILVKNAGHFNRKAGYAKFEMLRKDILGVERKCEETNQTLL
jgi:predicted alpha/beta hydrolase family esterase